MGPVERVLQASSAVACLIVGALTPAVSSACVPDVPDALLSVPGVLEHPAVTSAFKELERNLSGLFSDSTRDGLSFAVVHASSPEKVFAFNHGVLKFNETVGNDTNGAVKVDSDSIFRVASISKSFAALSALVVENESRSQNKLPPLTLETPVREVLPEFGLPEIDWQNGGSEITLSMLGTHSSGLPREGYLTPFNMVTGLAKANAETIGAEWAGVTPSEIIESFKTRSLMFAPGQRAAYSNAGSSLLAFAVVNYYNQMADTDLTWTEYTTQEILAPLNMTHSFFGAIPESLIPYIGVPGSPNWVDLLIGPGYDPAGGMWSSANDLAKFLYQIWLAPAPIMITQTQRRNSMQPRLILPDGKQQVGMGWEIAVISSRNTTYNIYGKSGDGGGFHSWLDAIPNLGYGLVILTSEGAPASADYTRLTPSAVRDAAHAILLPAFRAAYSALLAARFAGNYTGPRDGGAVAQQVNTTHAPNPYANESLGDSFARLEVKDDVLYARELVVNGTSVWEALDALGWTNEDQSRFFSLPEGVGMNPAEAKGANAAAFGGEQVGGGKEQAWWIIPPLEECDWFDFDGYSDENGWPLSKVVLVEGEQGVELHYPPFDIILTRPQ